MAPNETLRLPVTVALAGREATLRYMTAADKSAMLAFARALPAHDLLFLRRDITLPETIDAWIGELQRGASSTVLATDAASIGGYVTLDRNELRWMQHVAEIRVLTAPSLRGHGLGRLLVQTAFALALASGIEKLVAQMTIDQAGAIRLFKNLGFEAEAILRSQVKDAQGAKHDLLVLTHDVESYQRQLAQFSWSEALISVLNA